MKNACSKKFCFNNRDTSDDVHNRKKVIKIVFDLIWQSQVTTIKTKEHVGNSKVINNLFISFIM